MGLSVVDVSPVTPIITAKSGALGRKLTAGVVAGGQENTSCGLALADDMAGSRSRENAILADQKLLDAISGANLCDQLDDLGVPEAAITPNDEECACIRR